MASETLTNRWIKFLAPSFCTLVVSPTRQKVSDFVPLASVLLDSLNELDVLRVCPTTCTGAI